MTDKTQKKRKQTFPEEKIERRFVDNGEYLGMLMDLVEEGREVSAEISGNSMSPFLIHHRDRVILAPIDSPLKKGDIVMYMRANSSYVLHRIVKVNKDESFDICGDALDQIEKGVLRSQILARACAIERKGRIICPGSFFWGFFAKIWVNMIPMRRFVIRVFSILHSLFRR